MRNIDNVCSDMEGIFRDFKFSLQPTTTRFHTIFITKNGGDQSITVEVEIDEELDSAIISVLSTHEIGYRRLSIIMNRLIEELG